PSTVLTDTWEWDGTSWSKRTPATNPGEHLSGAMAFDANRNVMVLYGGGASGNQTWEYDGTNWLQRSPSTSPGYRQQHSMTYDTLLQQVLITGGYDSTMTRQSDLWSWDGTNWS